MASIFTYDPDPPRVASPWLQAATPNEQNIQADGRPVDEWRNAAAHLSIEPGHGVTRLQAEPQEGPIEYKLHLLLRPRRKFRSTSTGGHVSGSRHSQLANSQPYRSASETAIEPFPRSGAATPPTSLTQQTRQHRLEQLTTQLLWRLQQSSPHHTSSATNIILPSLPEALPELEAPQQPAKLLHGLEESHGALYEIGVSDDGTLVGLAEDEMLESLNNLRAMAACLGCSVEVLRTQVVGDCEWVENVFAGRKERRVTRTGNLMVAEALVKPYLQSGSSSNPAEIENEEGGLGTDATSSTQPMSLSTEQLRITLTGPTMSGKSSLLGTLTTSTVDNGRGKSRLSMLRHRHEISSGVTSSVTQEVLGYQDKDDGNIAVVNYATANVASWIDIHVASRGSRLLFFSDSAGHPRYRRTTLRGLVGWSPHWTLLCVPADDTEDNIGRSGSTQASQQNLGSALPDMNLAEAQLNLCLKLRLPLVVVITKLDLASKAGLRATLTNVLSTLKAVGRKPAILSNPAGDTTNENLLNISATVIEAAYNVALPLLNDPTESVPIVLTSAVEGTGIASLHGLLHELPIPESSKSSGYLYSIEDVYHKPAEVEGVIVSGLLRSGQISVGDTGMIGPFSTAHDLDESEESEERPNHKSHSRFSHSRSFPGALRDAHMVPPHFQLPNQEWRRFKVTSVRNLRLPVHSLLADQVGTVAIVPHDSEKKVGSTARFGGIRKGMVLTDIQPHAARSFVADFKREDLELLAVGNHVVVYISSVRASARVISARAPDPPMSNSESNGNGSYPFGVSQTPTSAPETDGQNDKVAGMVTASNLLVTFNFEVSKEFVLVGDQVLVMPGGGPGLHQGQERGEKGIAGLDGFVGTVVETFG
ncbi:hypothetical protein LTR37_004886 [Vermiconidia calcicola]|uniref:Uncharacterized protein n=1 Tax=Vermiconidia calcicola TaxID=1690605 RepID=A0ACC3NNH5_9PEZI|nr:hypothetical protein LTR37_004886 [Vermiconidia calcicola]